MQNFKCGVCGSRVYFKNVSCLTCGYALGYDPTRQAVVALVPDAQPGLFRRAEGDASEVLRYCANSAHGACNWLSRADDYDALCVACDLNRTIPNLSEPGSLSAWQELERAKKRLVYSLLRFGLPLDTSPSPPGRLIFDFTRNSVTGHLDGVININILEADSVERERQKQQFDEPYRSLLGHLRHESGHYYWQVLVENAGLINEFRDVFGDERMDYQAALQQHYDSGPKPDWPSSHVSAYASMHPWEDWAETWAHYIHMVDCVDTAEAEGMEPRAAGIGFGALWPFKSSDIYRDETFDSLMERWIPLTLALNSLTRSMGHADFYPFVISEPARRKLRFVHRAVRGAG